MCNSHPPLYFSPFMLVNRLVSLCKLFPLNEFDILDGETRGVFESLASHFDLIEPTDISKHLVNY